jgi:hypothetical protein
MELVWLPPIKDLIHNKRDGVIIPWHTIMELVWSPPFHYLHLWSSCNQNNSKIYSTVVPCIQCGFFHRPRPACCETEEGGERETDSCKIVEVHCPGAHSLLWSTSPTCQTGGRRYSKGSPPPPPTPHFSSQRPQRWLPRAASNFEVVSI